MDDALPRCRFCPWVVSFELVGELGKETLAAPGDYKVHSALLRQHVRETHPEMWERIEGVMKDGRGF